MSFKVNVKWGKEKYDNIELDTSEPPELFKAQIMSKTGVEPDRQKVMLKGSTLKDSWEGFKGLKNGVTILLMGSATALPTAPVEKTVFLEDLDEKQLATALKLPAGLENLGNTCYMNATIQCLRSIPELTTALKQYNNPLGLSAIPVGAPGDTLTGGMSQLVRDLERSSEPIQPITFLQKLFMCFPHFAEREEGGVYKQQDANEFWTEIVNCLKQGLKLSDSRSFIQQYLRLDFAETMKCVESEEEPVTNISSSNYQLSCFIDKDVKYMQTGLQNRLKEHITKKSAVLDRDAAFEKTSKISRLPAYLSVQFVRFFFKEKEMVNAKILKDVKFSMTLDLFDLCTPELQEKLIPQRTAMKEEEDKQQEAIIQAKLKGEPLRTNKKTEKKPYSFPDDLGSNNSGIYELNAVLTHKGRSSSSGHYVGWVRQSGDDWYMYDDDHVVAVKSEDILKLSGGGDWHTAYVLVYKPKILEVVIDQPAEVTEPAAVTEPMQQ